MEVSKTIARHWPVLLGIGLVLLGVAWRLSPHLPNFTPIAAIALVAGMALGWRKALWVVFGTMVISDLMLGFYSSIEWTWLSFALIAYFGWAVRKMPLKWRLPIGALGTSLMFFIVSNFGTWISSGMYSLNLAGLIQCYVMALPFFKATLLSDLLFGSLFIGAYEAASSFSKRRRQACAPNSGFIQTGSN